MLRKAFLSVLILSLLLFGCGSMQTGTHADKAAGQGLSKDIVVLFTSDVHCSVDKNFGYAGLKAVKDELEKAGNPVLLVDNGDAIQGEPIGTMTKGEAPIKLMNAVGYDAAIPGNHEFDYGLERFLELADKAEFPYISCNFNHEGNPVFEPYTIKEVNGTRIAFVGVTTPKTLVTAAPSYFKDDKGDFVYGFMQDESGEALYNAVQKAADGAKAEGADYVIVLGHLGNKADCSPWTYADIIANTRGIDALLDGHSHDTDKAVVKNKDGIDVVRQACGTKLNAIGWLRIGAGDGSVDTGLYTYSNDVPAPELFGIENEVTAEIDKATGELNKKLSEVVAHSLVELTTYAPDKKDAKGQPIRTIRRAETNLGDLCADAYREQTGADIAIVNGGGIRSGISKGDVTMNDILTVQPFGNMLTVIEATGQQLLDALEWGVHAMPEESGGFLQVSGLKYEIDDSMDSSCTADANGMFSGVTGKYRVKNVLVNGEPLEKTRTYTLASRDYILLQNGDGFTMFDGCKVLQEPIKPDYQALLDYITGTLSGEIGHEYADPYGQERITAAD